MCDDDQVQIPLDSCSMTLGVLRNVVFDSLLDYSKYEYSSIRFWDTSFQFSVHHYQL